MKHPTPYPLQDIRAVLFDLGNVLIDVDFHRCARFWSKQSGVPAETLASRFRIDRTYEDFECGRIPASAFYASLRRKLGMDLPDDVMREGWNRIIQGEKPGLRDGLNRLARRYPLYVLTNTNPEHEAVWAEKHRELLSVFKAVFVSSRMGCRKPEAEAYLSAAHAIGHPCDRILFFDDVEENVIGAQRCGMHAVRVTNSDTVAAAITPLAAEPPT